MSSESTTYCFILPKFVENYLYDDLKRYFSHDLPHYPLNLTITNIFILLKFK